MVSVISGPRVSSPIIENRLQVRLAWAMTMHRVQGQTVKKPSKILVALKEIFQPAMAYVAGSLKD